jgi:hypothetical protein
VAKAVATAAITGATTISARVTTKRASRTIRTIRATSQVIMMRRRSKRSATTPPSGPRATTGTTRAAVVIPAHSAEWVRS